MKSAILVLGGNIGDVADYIAMADRAITQRVGSIVRASQLYESEPWGFEAPTRFWNQALEVETELSAMDLLRELQTIENLLGRNREDELRTKELTGGRYASRTMDIDIIFYGDDIVDCDVLHIPHPMMREREFVLEPMVEIAPQRVDPQSGRTVMQLFNELERV